MTQQVGGSEATIRQRSRAKALRALPAAPAAPFAEGQVAGITVGMISVKPVP